MDTKTENAVSHSRSPLLFVLLFLLIGIIYSNSLSCSWHLDDNANILDNKNIHIETLDINSIVKTFYHWDYQHIYRPLTNLSFALNWFVGKNNESGYHLINIFIHFVTSCFLYLVTLKLLQTQHQQQASFCNIQFVAALSTALWATNPIHVQAITYIVQRATLLSTLFSILSLYFYLVGREKPCLRFSLQPFILCLLFFLFALSSKENAILLPGSMLLIEIVFLMKKPISLSRETISTGLVSASGIILVTYLLTSLIVPGKISLEMFGYSERNFTLCERLLTEPRVLLYYLSQIVYPVSSRLSLEHDVILSTSLFSPWTTLPAILVIFCAIVMSLYSYRKYPLLAFAILFFFYNHLVESSILPLEIFFEHRNYLPSFFLFLPAVYALSSIGEKAYQNNRLMFYLVNGFFILLLIFFGIGTYTRNFDWQNNKSLLIDNITKAPNQARPYNNLAGYLLNEEKNIDGALTFFNAALMKESPSKHGSRFISYMGMANIYIAYKNDHLSAIPLIEKAIAERPEALTPRKKLIISQINTGFHKEAAEQIEILLEKRGLDYKLKENEKISRSYLLNLKALVALKEDSLPLAQTAAKESIILDPDDPFALANLGTVLFRMANYKQSTHYLTKLQKIQGKPNLLTSFLLLENYLRANYMSQANELGLLILTSFPLNEVFSTLSLLEKPNMAQPIDHKLLRSFLTDSVNKIGALKNFDVHPSHNIL